MHAAVTAASTWLPDDAKPTSTVTIAIRMHAPIVILTSQAGRAGRDSRPVETHNHSPPAGTSRSPTRPSAQAIADSGTASGSCPPGKNARNVAAMTTITMTLPHTTGRWRCTRSESIHTD
jgi:hypothetical protein